MMNTAQWIDEGRAVIGIEFGSTRIKAILIDADLKPAASGSYDWENRLENGVWTYHMQDVIDGLQGAYASLKKDALEKYGVIIRKAACIGISGMMHGYLPFDKDGKQLAEFRTWRNTMTAEAAEKLTGLFGFNIPQRWSIAHLYQAMLNNEAHVKDIAHINTLAGHVHELLTGKRVLGIGEASGVFPIDSAAYDYDAGMKAKFDALVEEAGYAWNADAVLPEVLAAGDDAGSLTADGAKLIDPDGDLMSGIPFCPPEGDAGTGMAATDSISAETGNVSAGTSIFSMVVLDKPLKKVHPEIDMVTTPVGKPVAMVHCNNCTSDINAYVGLLQGFAAAAGKPVTAGEVYTALFTEALKGETDCGGVINYNYFSGEPVLNVPDGRPMLVRLPDSELSFANFARSLVFGSVVTLSLGMKILTEDEKVPIRTLYGHGGLFKTGTSGQKLLSAALNAPVCVMETAGEGGPWGMALLAAYRAYAKKGQTLDDYLNTTAFAAAPSTSCTPDEKDVEGFESYAKRFTQGLDAQKAAAAIT